jgi:hypothetical protein
MDDISVPLVVTGHGSLPLGGVRECARLTADALVTVNQFYYPSVGNQAQPLDGGT